MALITALWLLGNYLWCFGELVYEIDGKFRFSAAIIMSIGLFLWLVQRFWLAPNDFIKEDEKTINMYRNAGLIPRYKFLGKTWREAEHLHTFLWLAKDLCWSIGPTTRIAWTIFFIPTLILSIDFIWPSWKAPKMIIDTTHYLIQLIWLSANFTWALTELWLDGPDKAQPLAVNSPKVGRWVSAWLLIMSYVILFILYLVWIPLTAYGYIKIKESSDKEYGLVMSPLNHHFNDKENDKITDKENNEIIFNA